MPGSTELSPQYNPQTVEAGLYRTWMERGAFAPTAGPGREPYVIVIPPPNVTGVLHMGHGLNNTIQDVLIRFERARGRETLWLPGTDHAGIATQNVVERLIAKEGKTRFDLGREAFVQRVWAFVKETGNTILEQLKQIGASCDWTRTRFTLDPAYTRAVREVFVRLWEEKLIYRGHRVIHWCPRCLTALSDEEAESKEIEGKLYYIHYPLSDGSGRVTVATTRPETLLGDTAVVVHPDDPRGAPYIGKRVKLPITGIEVPVLGDESVDKEFGTGFVKVTPAHDANDFEIGLRHGLAMPLVMRENATMGEDDGQADGRSGGRDAAQTARPSDRPRPSGSPLGTARVPKDLVGVDRFVARKQIVKQLEAEGLLAKVESHHHNVRHCYRCDSIVEPRLSDQWFVKMKPLAEPVLDSYRRGEITIVPERWNATFLNWMENIRDWNISRQLWWGHRIPVFTCTKCKHEWADREDRTRCPKCGGPVEQDPDVLDTWFSSWLWPFATLGWPDETPDLRRYYPGHTLVTAPEILFFWVARMLMAGFHFMGKKPFTTVYLTGTVRDAQHRRMSKSLGNGIDPLDVVRLYGADALRWTLIASGSLGADVVLDHNDLETTFATGRNFANKLWNIARFLLPHLPTEAIPLSALDPETLTLADRWMLSRTEGAVAEATAALEQFRLDEAAKRCFELAWGELADWYVETAKPRLAAGDQGARAASAVLLHAWDTVLRLLHPVVPFITEELWQKLPGRRAGELLITAPWPTPDRKRIDPQVEAGFGAVQQAITAIRNIRAEYRVSPKVRLAAAIRAAGPAARGVFESERETIVRLAQLESVTSDGAALQGAHAVLSDGSEVVVALTGAIDLGQECRRLSDELTRLDKQLDGLVAKLANEQFISRAPQDVVTRERQKEQAWRTQRDALAGKLAALGCG